MNLDKFEFGKRVPKSEDNPKKWKNVELKEIDTLRPVVLCFGGNGTISPQNANGMSKSVESILDLEIGEDFIDIYSILYNETKDKKGTGEISFEECKKISNNFFIPLVIKRNKRLDTKTACENMRNINIFTFCYGASLVGNMFSYVAQEMREKDYTEPEIKKILGQVLHVGFEPYGENSYVTNFEIKSFSDEAFGAFYKEEYKNQTNKKGEFLGCGEIVVDKNTINLYVSNMAGEDREPKDHDIGWIISDIHGKALPNFLKPVNVLLEEDLTKEDLTWQESLKNINYPRANAIASCVALTLSMGVSNSKFNKTSNVFAPLPSVEKIANFSQQILDKANKADYEKRQKDIFVEFDR